MLGTILTVLIALLAVAAVAGAVFYQIKNRGKSCCGGCDRCSRNGTCAAGHKNNS